MMRWKVAARKSALSVRNFETSAHRFARNGQSHARNVQRPAKNAQRPVRNAHRPARNAQRTVRSVQKPVKSVHRSATSAHTSATSAHRSATSAHRPAKSARELEKYSPMIATLLCKGQTCEALATRVRVPLVNPETNFLLLVEDLEILILFLGEDPEKLSVSLLMNTAYLRKQVAHAKGSTEKYDAHALCPP